MTWREAFRFATWITGLFTLGLLAVCVPVALLTAGHPVLAALATLVLLWLAALYVARTL